MTLPTSESDATVLQIAPLFGVEAIQIQRVSGGFSGAAVYQASTAQGERYAIRRTPLNAAIPADRLRLLHQLLAHVQSSGVKSIAVPRQRTMPSWVARDSHQDVPLSPWNSATSVELNQHLWQVEPWLPGTPVNGVPTRLQLHSAFGILHALYKSAATFGSQASSNPWFFTGRQKSPGVYRRLFIAQELSAGLLTKYESVLERDPDPQFRQLALRMCDVLRGWLPWLLLRLARLSDLTFSLQPVIRDLWRPHVLFTGDDLTGLIDLTAMASDHIGFDLTRLLRSWYAGNTDGVREAVEFFATIRPLTTDERLLLEAVDGAGVLLSPVTWLRRRVENGDKAAVSADVLERLKELTRTAEVFSPLELVLRG